MFEHVVVPDLQQAIQQQIKRYILENGLRQGARLPTEEELARRIGASRTALREALSGLEALGILEVRHGSGRYVRSFTFSPILDNLSYSMLFDVHTFEQILDVRAELEIAFLPKAIAVLTDDHLADVKAALESLEELGQGGLWTEKMLEQDMHFHHLLFQHVGNDLLLKLLDIFWTVHMGLHSQPPYRTRDVPAFLRQHRNLYEAIARRDADLACQRLREHFQGVREWIATEKASHESRA